MNNENLIHVKLENNEAIQSKRNILSSELSLLKAIKFMKRYEAIKSEELRLKAELYKQIRGFTLEIKNIQTILPKPKIPSILKKEQKSEEKKLKKTSADEDYLESELKEIQEKLKSIGG
ncbi:hypothetical protein DRN69_03620 [Candidatus Pacearchaeota archaeon]|nr:MAG: hypothetical protein DRN69_03620 [Candidatus Pacearchaeota archaeon]